jgi:MFS family permease
MGPFRRLWVASTASNLGDGVLIAALPLLARETTASPVAISLVTVAARAPWLLFGLLAGVAVDRRDRLATMVRVDVLRATALGATAVAAVGGVGTGRDVPLGVLVVLVFALGVGETLFDTAAQALLPQVVDADRLEAANGRLLAGQLAANEFVGPALGGVLVAVAAAAPLAVDAVTFAVSAAVLAALRRERANATAVTVERATTSTVWADVREGLAWLWSHRDVRALAVGAAVVNLAHTAAMAVLVLLVRDELGAGAAGYGFVLAVSAVGGVAGSFSAAPVVAWVGRRAALLGSLAAFTAGLAVTGAAHHPAVVAVGLALFGVGGEVWNVVAVSYRQARVPDALIGRVMATYRFVAYGAMPVGAALGGVVAAAAGTRVTFVAGAALTAALALHLGRVSFR